MIHESQELIREAEEIEADVAPGREPGQEEPPPRRAPMIEQEQKRWDRLRRAMLNIVAQQHDVDPDAQYTLDIKIVPKDRSQKIA